MDTQSMERSLLVTGVAHETGIVKFAIFDVPDRPGTAFQLFSALAENSVNVDIIVQSAAEGKATDVLFTVSKNDFEKTKKVLDSAAAKLGANKIVYRDGLC